MLSRSKKATKKTSGLTDKMTTKKQLKKNRNEVSEYDDVDSLVFLKNTSTKKPDDIDTKIKLLKTELKSLISGIKPYKNFDSSADSLSNLENNDILSDIKVEKAQPKVFASSSIKSFENSKDLSNSQINKALDFKPCSSSTPTKFSEWLNVTIDEINSQTKKQKFSDVNEISSSSKSINNISEESSLFTTDSKSKLYNTSSLSKDRVEQLLYKSFLIQNSDSPLLVSESINSRTKSIKKTKKPNPKQVKLAQKNSIKNSKPSLRRTKRRLISLNSTQKEIQVINLDSSNNDASKNSVVCVDLDVNNYSWNESFHLNDTEMEVLEVCEKIGNNSNKPEFTLSDTELVRSDSSFYTESNKKTRSKRQWECPVCFEPSKGQDIVATQCGHVFCRKCLESHMSKLTKSCPTCRTDLTDKPFINLFNF